MHDSTQPTSESPAQPLASSAAPEVSRTGSARDKSLVELHTSRNLQKVVGSVERFLLNQVDRFASALEESQQIADQGATVQRLLVGLEDQKQEWEQQRQEELRELDLANEKLVQGWKALEEERRQWLVERENHSPTVSKKANRPAASQQPVNQPVPSEQEAQTITEQQQWELMQQEIQQHSRNRR